MASDLAALAAGVRTNLRFLHRAAHCFAALGRAFSSVGGKICLNWRDTVAAFTGVRALSNGSDRGTGDPEAGREPGPVDTARNKWPRPEAKPRRFY